MFLWGGGGVVGFFWFVFRGFFLVNKRNIKKGEDPPPPFFLKHSIRFRRSLGTRNSYYQYERISSETLKASMIPVFWGSVVCIPVS